MARHEYWTHGVGVIVEFADTPVEVRRAGWGMRVRQRSGTENWFHFALPSPAVMNSEGGLIREAFLRAEVNENARLDAVHFRVDGNRPLRLITQGLPYTDRIIDENFQTPDTRFRGGLVLSVHLSFLTGEPLGTVTFRSAGVAVLT
jgi:hypothetical protein